jgi:hypothetical protein
MPYKPLEIESMLKTKLKMTPSNADHKWYVLQIDDIPPIRTKISHTKKKDIGPELENRIQKQLRVRKKFFRELMDCTKSFSDYEAQVRADPYPPFNHLFV